MQPIENSYGNQVIIVCSLDQSTICNYCKVGSTGVVYQSFLFDSQFLKMKRPQEIGNPNHDFL